MTGAPEARTEELGETKGPMRMLLTRVQRYVLIGVAALVGIVLVIQADEEGLRDTPWLFGLIVIAVLLLLAFAPRRR